MYDPKYLHKLTVFKENEPGDIFTVHLRQNGNLLHDIIDIVLCIVKVNDFNRNRLMRILVISISLTTSRRIKLTLCKRCRNFLDLQSVLSKGSYRPIFSCFT
jgi:hypothetical protein